MYNFAPNKNKSGMSKKSMTQQQAQATWDKIRDHIRLAPFNDDGISLPHIDMAKIFNGRQSMSWNAITDEMQRIVESWQPSE